jgi:hypothetical protein
MNSNNKNVRRIDSKEKPSLYFALNSSEDEDGLVVVDADRPLTLRYL